MFTPVSGDLSRYGAIICHLDDVNINNVLSILNNIDCKQYSCFNQIGI